MTTGRLKVMALIAVVLIQHVAAAPTDTAAHRAFRERLAAAAVERANHRVRYK